MPVPASLAPLVTVEHALRGGVPVAAPDVFGLREGEGKGRVVTPDMGPVSDKARLREFVRESNRIEGIVREPSGSEMAAHAVFLALPRVTVADMEAFVAEVAGRPLRRAYGQDVWVGRYRPPPGGPHIEDALARILSAARAATPYEVHVRYETLHPFLDGNGRSGRALWAWQMLREGRDPFALPFLHRWYYDSLEASRG